MNFEMTLRIPRLTGEFQVAQVRDYDPELHDVGSVLRDVCETLESLGCQFIVRIGSSELWPATVRTDLLVVLEQLSDVLARLADDKPTQLDFYEQGIERTVTFEPKGAAMQIGSHDIVVPSSMPTTSMIVSREIVVDALCRLATDFISASIACAGKLAAHPWFMGWAYNLTQSIAKVQRAQPPSC